MTRRRPITLLCSAAVIPLTALTVAACGGGGVATASPRPAPSETTTTRAQTATVRVANSRLGRILVDSSGHTLYLFKADSGTSSACSGACAVAWPPLRTGATPVVTGGANATLVGTISRSDGARQVTYDGHPLYTFVKDRKPGDVIGQGVTAFGAAWFAVSPAGDQVSSQPTGHGHGSASRQPAPAAPPATTPQPAPKPTRRPAPKSAAKPAPPVAKPAAPANGIPQNNGGDGDRDNNGGPSDGDGNV
jgi:predicted lipoprotein with Yx(FWY)xxD motif